MNSHVPFAVVGSTDFVRIGNKMVRSRQYPWGTVQGNYSTIILRCFSLSALWNKFNVLVENESHCDFVKLREMLIRTNMEDMREKTHARHYELYRKKRLQQMGFTDVDSDNKPVSLYWKFHLSVTIFLIHFFVVTFRSVFNRHLSKKEAHIFKNYNKKKMRWDRCLCWE